MLFPRLRLCEEFMFKGILISLELTILILRLAMLVVDICPTLMLLEISMLGASSSGSPEMLTWEALITESGISSS